MTTFVRPQMTPVTFWSVLMRNSNLHKRTCSFMHPMISWNIKYNSLISDHSAQTFSFVCDGKISPWGKTEKRCKHWIYLYCSGEREVKLFYGHNNGPWGTLGSVLDKIQVSLWWRFSYQLIDLTNLLDALYVIT